MQRTVRPQTSRSTTFSLGDIITTPATEIPAQSRAALLATARVIGSAGPVVSPAQSPFRYEISTCSVIAKNVVLQCSAKSEARN